MGDIESELRDRVLQAREDSTALALRGGGSKDFFGREITGERLSVSGHSGIIDYHPTELVITARAGTSLKEIRRTLAANGQMPGFEAPMFSPSATLGGAAAAGLCGPRRPYAGSISDFVLGARILNGNGEILRFGGQVMKNVAGFDISRLMVGSMGCLGIILEVSLKVLPVPEKEETLLLNHGDPDDSLKFMAALARKPLPVSAAAWVGGETRIRLSGSDSGVAAAMTEIGGQRDSHGESFWTGLCRQSHEFFNNKGRLLRASVPPAALHMDSAKPQLIDWGGGLRWTWSDADNDDEYRSRVKMSKGHLSIFRNGDRSAEVFAPLDPVSMKYHQRLKTGFDPHRIFNPGRMYAWL